MKKSLPTSSRRYRCGVGSESLDLHPWLGPPTTPPRVRRSNRRCRQHQANVVLFIPGEPGYTPHWNVNVVHTAAGVTVQDIIDAGFGSEHFGDEGVLFDDVEDIEGAEDAGLVYTAQPGVVVLCPIVPEVGAEAPGINELPEVFAPFDLGSGF